VTNGQDANPNPPAGSLRFVLDNAHPGDTVTFCGSTLVRLVAPLDMVSGEDGVTVTGGLIGAAVAEGSIVRVKAARGVKFTHDKFFSVRLAVIGADRVQLSDVQFYDALSHGQANDPLGLDRASEATIEADRADGLTLEHVEVNAIQDAGLYVHGSDGVTVAGNSDGNSVFNVMHHTAIEVVRHPRFPSKALTIRDTTSDGMFHVAPFSGSITANTINTGSQGRGILVTDPGEFHHASYGTLTVSDNKNLIGASIAVQRSNINVSGNIVTNGPGISVRCDPKVAHAKVELTGNRSIQTEVGLAYLCESAGVEAISHDNRAIQNTFAGFRFGARKLASSHDSATDGKGDGFQLSARLDRMSLTADTATTDAHDGINAAGDARAKISGGTFQSNGMAGVHVDPGRGRGDVVMSASSVTGNRGGPGVQVGSGARVSIQGGAIQNNTGGAGVAVGKGAQVRVSRVAMGGNAGPGILGSPVTPPKLVYRGHAIFGLTCAGCVVEAFTIESGRRDGNPANGEGVSFVRELRAGANGQFIDRVRCELAKQLTFTATRGTPGNAPETSGFSHDVSCMEPLLHVFARVTYGGDALSACAVQASADGTVVTITDPVNTTPVEYYSYFTHPRACDNPARAARGTVSIDALNADGEKNEKALDSESQQEDGTELALPSPAIEPDTTVYAAHLEECSTTMSGRQPNGVILYLAPSCSDQERVNIEVINHMPGA
jgi:Right handed beta helix region